MSKPKNFPGVVAVRLPQEIDEKVRAASQVTGVSMSNLIRAALVKAWGVGQESREMQPGG